ncbi:sulfotransferase family protein [Cognatishimia sp. F0-27]|uniref:sulfotransferase family protein n=1 Tax=Cognatishimia sp. F0-27 TaxID=2816855 RepID=UPI001D0BF6B0|nr:sulfotransferase family protein [Cognatishimia sp. F0-27]MCC1493447.1 sulfotransferase family protein [Cognatishimia sp. F0-27]
MIRIVNLGLPKSGTTTLAKALRSAGLRVADHRLRRRQTRDPELAGSFVGRQIYEGYFGSGDPLVRLQGFDALSEISVLTEKACFWPQGDPAILNAMRQQHPDLRFVATWRKPEAICTSMDRWGDLGRARIPAAALPGLPHGFGHLRGHRLRWIEDHYRTLDRLFAGDANYLRLDVADPDAADRLGAHAGLVLPWWGIANATSGTTMQQAGV